MSNNKRKYPIINFGSSLLLVVFLILCLVTFAVLTLSSAANDYELSRKLSVRKTSYYEANNQAEELLKEIDQILKTGGSLKEASSLSTDSILVTAETDDNGLSLISFSVPINDAQVLAVCLEIIPSVNRQSSTYRVLKWQVVSTAEWESDNSVTLIYDN